MQNNFLFFCSLILLSPVLLAGCGKKSWPTADASIELFQWKDLSYGRQDKCLNINATIKGRIANLKKVVLLLEESGNICPDCPFQDTELVAVYSDYSGENTKSSFELRYCKLKRDKQYRFRLKGINKYPNLKDPKSEVYTVN